VRLEARYVTADWLDAMQAFKTTDKKRTGTIATKSLKDILETIQKGPLTNQQSYLITGQLEFGEYMTVRATMRISESSPGAPPSSRPACSSS
jgi:Ca2+-binding EF-hand superfamily protein